MGAGHNATGQALEEAARGVWPGVEVGWLQTLRVMGPGVGPLLRHAYTANVEHTPWLYQFFYDQIRARRWFAETTKRVIGSWAGRRMERLITAWAPDAIISTYPMESPGWPGCGCIEGSGRRRGPGSRTSRRIRSGCSATST